MAVSIVSRCLALGTIAHRLQLHTQCRHYYAQRKLTSQELATALRPFYFSVHPDLFWQHPHEKEVNENSLKQLKSYLESPLYASNPSSSTNRLTFYIRSSKEDLSAGKLKTVNIRLNGKSLHEIVHNLLIAFELSTDYLDSLKPKGSENPASFFEKLRQDYDHARRAESEVKRVKDKPLGQWLKENIAEAQQRAESCSPVKQEVHRLTYFLMEEMQLRDIVWDCGWGVSHFRGSLLSFHTLIQHYPFLTDILKGRIIIFGQRTGVSLDGHIVLSCGDVKHTWLDLLQSIDHFDNLLSRVPYVENSLSEVLRGISIDHRKFQPVVMVQKYLQQLGKLTSALYKFRWQHGYPNSWPRRLDQYQLVVECEAGPLMLSPTGQFIVPASCPAFLMVDFISVNMNEADKRLSQYESEKEEEQELHDYCRTKLGLASLEKDDNVTPDLMIRCCKRLIENSSHWSSFLRGTRLRVSNFYSVLRDGDICIPWDWED